MNSTGTVQGGRRSWWRGLRPLLLWALLVSGLFGYRAHERALARTRLLFEIKSPALSLTEVTLDGRPVLSGFNISLGRHRFEVIDTLADTFTTNLFIWYGGRDLGRIELKRSQGTLDIAVVPKAETLSVRGTEFSETLRKTAGLTLAVPTGAYLVSAKFRHMDYQQEVIVGKGARAPLRIAPAFGTIQLKPQDTNQTGITFELVSKDGRPIESGAVPAVLEEIPVGEYTLVTRHGEHQLRESVIVRARETTNDITVGFAYGAVTVETQPPGVMVRGENDRDYGQTPLTIRDLTPGNHAFTLRVAGQDDLEASLSVQANQTNVWRTNLLLRAYAKAITNARGQLQESHFEAAAGSAEEALRLKPEDGEAKQLRDEAVVRGHLRDGVRLASRGELPDAIKRLDLALAVDPDHLTVKELRSKLVEQQLTKMGEAAEERANQPKRLFYAEERQLNDYDLFEMHELRTKKPLDAIRAALLDSLRKTAPTFHVAKNISPQPETFHIEAEQENGGQLRRCVIVAGRVSDTETHILFKVLEYRRRRYLNTVDELFTGTARIEYLAVHPKRLGTLTSELQAQLKQGVEVVEGKIQGAARD